MPVREQLQCLSTFQADDFFLMNRTIYHLTNPITIVYIAIRSYLYYITIYILTK
jgi:hypothetical protein